MKVIFEDDNLARLESDANFRDNRSVEQVRAFRKVVNLIRQATKSPDLYSLKSLRLEKLLGKMKGYHSMRLNDQFRLVVQFGNIEGQETVVIVRIEDYH